MPLIPFPDIPDVLGVPPIPRLPSIPSFVSIPTAGTLVRSGLGLLQGALYAALQTDTRWGVFNQDGEPLGDPSLFTGLIGTLIGSVGFGPTWSTAGVEYSKAGKVSDFPIERGKFAQYNKVEMPGEASVTLAFTGSESQRTEFLDAIDAACKSVDLYDVATPEVTYIQYSIENYSYRRTAQNGATLLIVDLHLLEIRQVSARYTNNGSPAEAPSTPDAEPPISSGLVQALPSPQAVLQSVGNKVSELATTAANQARSMIASVFN